MPWSIGDVDSHKRGLTDEQKKRWVSIANNVLKSCVDDGGNREQCEGKAIRIANAKAIVKKESDMTDEVDADVSEMKSRTELTQDKDYAKAMTYVPWGVTSFAELDQAHEAQEMAGNVHDMASSFSTIVSNIMSREEVTDKAKAIESLANEFATRVRSKMSDDSDHKEMDQKYKAILEIDDPLAVYYAFYDLGYDLDDEDKLKELPDEVRVKAVWSSAAKNDLPDSSFMFISPGCGEKDETGKTKPRSCRHFPIKSADGAYDAAHVRNAIARIPQSNATGLSAEKKNSLQERARKILAGLNKEQNPGFFEAVKETVSDAFKSFLHPNKNKDESSFMVWKEGDSTRWFARYSNWFRDDDNPPEIISEQSHRFFVEEVNKAKAPYPELWLWHVPQWKLGKADWLAYDDSGFALASGTIDRGKEAAADWLTRQKDLGVSHGMPTSSIVRDEDDPSIIIQHITSEISPLPRTAAANKLTGFIVLGGDNQEEKTMAIPEDKKAKLIGLGIDPELLQQLETQNATDAEKAAQEGREYKEATEAVVETAQAEGDAERRTVAATTEVKPEDVPPTRLEVAEAFATVIQPLIDKIGALETSLNAQAEEVKALKTGDDEKIKQAVSSTPAASVAAILAQKLSAIGSSETKVSGNDSLAKSKPKEAAPEQKFGVPFLDAMLNQPKQE